MRQYLNKKNYLKLLSLCYLIGFGLHVLDLLGLRLNFASMSTAWKIWIIYLTVFDFLVAVSLLYRPLVGIFLFHVVALSQLYAYMAHEDYFGRQDFLVVFHIVTLTIYWKLVAREKRHEREQARALQEQHILRD